VVGIPSYEKTGDDNFAHKRVANEAEIVNVKYSTLMAGSRLLTLIRNLGIKSTRARMICATQASVPLENTIEPNLSRD
jgi:hypothetical protein